MKAFHGDPLIKEKYINRVLLHQAADSIIQGQGWEDGKGCAIGCTLENYNHEQYERELGVPVELAYLIDGIFEGLPKDQAKLFPAQVLEAINPGADLSKIINNFLVWLLVGPEHGVINFVEDDKREIIDDIAKLHLRIISGDPPTKYEWDAARAAASGAARDAAWGAAAWDAAWDAAWAAAWDAARAAAWGAARGAARDAAWGAARGAQKEKLLQLLREAI